MRIGPYNSQKKEETFKASKVANKSKTQIQSEDSDNEEALLVKSIKRGISKYKGKLPLKCFNCGGIGHFASKFPYPKQEDDEECPEDSKKNNMIFKKKNKKKTFYLTDDNCSNESSEDEDDEVLFMGIENKIPEEETEGVVDLEVELVSALEELGKYKRSTKKKKII